MMFNAGSLLEFTPAEAGAGMTILVFPAVEDISRF